MEAAKKAEASGGGGGGDDISVPDFMKGDEPGAGESSNLFTSEAIAFEDEDQWQGEAKQTGTDMKLSAPGTPATSAPPAADDTAAGAATAGKAEAASASKSDAPAPASASAAKVSDPNQTQVLIQHEGRDPRVSHASQFDNEDPSNPAWAKHEKHVFILSLAGKPIYSRYGNEDKLASIMGVMQALVSFVEDDKDELESLIAGEHKFVFQVQSNLLLVMVSSTGESTSQMRMQLNYVYNQILFVLTLSQLSRVFQQQNFDLRRMLGGTEKFIDNLLDMFDTNPSFFLGAVRCLPLQSSVREKIGHVLLSSRHKDLVFALLVANNQLVALLRPRKYSLHPADVHLIFNNITSSGATNFQSAELWMPLCLPRFNNTGFLHAHVSFVDEECTTCLLLITNEKNSFYELKQCRTKIVQALSSNGCLTDIAKASAMRGFHLNNIEIPDLRHFLYKSKSTSQFTAPVLDPPYNLPGEEQRLFRRYQYVHHRIHSTARPLKIYFHVGQKETILGWVTFGFELYACFSPLVTKPAAINAVLRLIRWMKREEDGLFIMSSLVF